MQSAFGVEHIISKGVLRPKKVIGSWRQSEDGVYKPAGVAIGRKDGKLQHFKSDSMEFRPDRSLNDAQKLNSKMSRIHRRVGFKGQKKSVSQKVRGAFSRYEVEEVKPSATYEKLRKPENRSGSTVVTRQRPLERVPGTYIAGGGVLGVGGGYAAYRKKAQ